MGIETEVLPERLGFQVFGRVHFLYYYGVIGSIVDVMSCLSRLDSVWYARFQGANGICLCQTMLRLRVRLI